MEQLPEPPLATWTAQRSGSSALDAPPPVPLPAEAAADSPRAQAAAAQVGEPGRGSASAFGLASPRSWVTWEAKRWMAIFYLLLCSLFLLNK